MKTFKLIEEVNEPFVEREDDLFFIGWHFRCFDLFVHPSDIDFSKPFETFDEAYKEMKKSWFPEDGTMVFVKRGKYYFNFIKTNEHAFQLYRKWEEEDS